ncbi:hypothetical protein [Pelagibacterium luteolum]|uniref:Uncharacterized protein n=1 Tax=Pelagibacterium luteolum TaxID=440168 RepID=A0A1G7URU1_9HYPH|nr:hypothetical protein [Pelagibacterium luteolum]SDG50252.1 hypothetical protein SAMN04487974_103239 [Pelagibacterium luteolum]
MNGKMYKLTGTGRFGKAPLPKGPRYQAPLPKRRNETIADHLPKTDTAPLPLPDKLKGK